MGLYRPADGSIRLISQRTWLQKKTSSQLGFCVAYVDIIITTLLEPNLLSDKIPESVLRVGLGVATSDLICFLGETLSLNRPKHP